MEARSNPIFPPPITAAVTKMGALYLPGKGELGLQRGKGTDPSINLLLHNESLF